MRQHRFQNLDVAKVFKNYPNNIRQKLLLLRQIIIDTASNTKEVGILEETLKWGEPSYLTVESKSGSTIRLGWKKSSANQYGIYFNCKTTLIDTFKGIYGDLFQYQGNRAIIFNADDDIPIEWLKNCISLGLTYHVNKK
ncbi:DUF1801 domain-containing protein [soil metagenome]